LSLDKGTYFSYETTEEGCKSTGRLYIPVDEVLVKSLDLKIMPVDRSKLSYSLINVKKKASICSGIISNVIGGGNSPSGSAETGIKARTRGMERYCIRRIASHFQLREDEIAPLP
jgi:hypothetical protein